jgi:hypothetical protein
VIDPAADPRTEDTIVYELVERPAGEAGQQVVGRAVFRGGRTSVEAPERVSTAVEELLARGFVDRVRADERPRGYRRSRAGLVDMLVPGMPEHFIARMRGLWLSYPDGTVVTARGAAAARGAATAIPRPERSEAPPVTDPSVRRATLAAAETTIGARPLVVAHEPELGIRPGAEAAPDRPISRTDCGWLV